MAPSNQFTLSSGHSIPWLAYGNGSGAAKEVAEEATRWAIDAGLAHLDTAQGYASSKGSNEAVTGQAIAPYDRSKLYITTKISQEGGKPWNPPVPLNDLRTSVLKSIERLGGQPDLLLIHSPRVIEKGKMKEYWQVLERMRDEAELTADLGISNFRPQDIEELMSIARIKPVLHRALDPSSLLTIIEVVCAQSSNSTLSSSRTFSLFSTCMLVMISRQQRMVLSLLSYDILRKAVDSSLSSNVSPKSTALMQAPYCCCGPGRKAW